MRLLATLLALTLILPAMAADDFKPEDGFVLLFNGKNLDGWKAKPPAKEKDKQPDALDGKAEAFAGRFKVADAIITIDPKVKGDVIIETAKAFGGDLHLKFDFKPDDKCNNDLFFRGQKFDIKKADVKNLKEGEWNEFEIVVKDGKAEFRCNGESLKTVAVKADKTPFGVRAEAGGIQLRRLRIKAAE